MIRTGLLAACLAAPAIAQEAIPCDWAARADAIVEPWEENTATFANGAVRLALMDVVEPAAAAFHILILSPPHDEIGARQCRTLGQTASMGFGGVDWDNVKADYGPAVGLIFEIPVEVYDGDYAVRRMLRFTLDQSTGAIGASM